MSEEFVKADPDSVNTEPPTPPDMPLDGKARRPRLRWWQKLALVGFSFLLLGLAELALRLVGYGPNTDFVVPRLDRGGERIMGINPDAYKRFHGRLALGSGQFAPWREFIDPKPANTFRIMFMGASTVEGYPHARNGAAAAFLEAMLQKAWPDKRVEVINCGVTAINSWSIRLWVLELLEYQPDLLILYAGHNEFYGGFGPASLNGAGTNRARVLAHIWLRDLRLARLMSDVVAWVMPAGGQPQGLLMEQLARERSIPLESDIYAGCRDNYRANLEDITRAARDANVPLALCSLVSNEKDLVPMNSVHRVGLSPDERKQWEAHFNAGREAAGNHRWGKAIAEYEEALHIDDTYAELVYRLAEASEALYQYDQARALYRRARDLDALRFRATAEFSEIVREVAGREQALFVDMLPAFESASPHGLIGWNLMTDHLHPTVFGHYLMARTICETLARVQNPTWPAIETSRLPSFEQVADQLGNDKLSEMMAKATIYVLSDRFPYAGTPNEALHDRLESEILEWQSSLTGPMAIGHQNWSNARSWDTLHYHVGQAYLEAGEYEQAIAFFRRAEQMSEPHSLEAARVKLGLLRAWLASAGEGDARKAVQASGRDLQAWFGDAAAMHPDQRVEFEKLRQDLTAVLTNTGG